MGIISNQLKHIKTHLDKSKESVNAKYQVMDMEPINKCNVSQLPPAIDDIPVLNTCDGTATAQDILAGKIAYVNGEKIKGDAIDFTNASFVLNVEKVAYMSDSKQHIKISGSKDKNTMYGPSSHIYVKSEDIATLFDLTPDKIKKDITVLDVTGTYEGTNTNDATATAEDIIKNKTAYVNGKKITGTLNDFSTMFCGIEIHSFIGDSAFDFRLPGPVRAVCTENTQLTISFSKIAAAIGLTADIIKKGETVLGITGTYEGETGGEDVPDDDPDEIEKTEDDFSSLLLYETVPMRSRGPYALPGYEELSSISTSVSDEIYLYCRIFNAYYYNAESHNVGYICNEKGSGKNRYFKAVYKLGDKSYLSVFVGDLDLTVEECTRIKRCVTYDNPGIIPKFAGYRYFTKEDDNTKVEYLLLERFDEATRSQYKETCFNTFKAICAKINQLYGIDTSGAQSSYDKHCDFNTYTAKQKYQMAKVIHDYLVLNNTYGDSSIEHLDQTMYPALSGGADSPVCASYAHAFQWCCGKLGIKCIPVTGMAGESHMWNLINYISTGSSYTNAVMDVESASWQEVDVTWDDPTNQGPTFCYWKYFNVTTDFMTSDHGRTKSIYGETDNGTEWLDHFPNATSTLYLYTGNTQYGGIE